MLLVLCAVPKETRRTSSATSIHLGPISIDFLVDADDSGGGVTVFELAEVLTAAAGGTPDMAALGEVMRRQGLTPAQPIAT